METARFNSKKYRILLIVTLLIIYYLLFNTSLLQFVPATTINTLVKPIFWILIVLLVMSFPNARTLGKIRLRGFLNWWSFNLSILFVFIWIGAGIIEGFGRSPYDHSFNGILRNIFIVVTTIIGMEVIRSYLINNIVKKENYLWVVFLSLFFVLIKISWSSIGSINDLEGAVKYFAEFFAPELSKSILATYLVLMGGAISSIIFLITLELFHWLSPILPDLKWITSSLIGTLFPIFSLILLQSIYAKEAKQINSDRKKENPITLMISAVVSIGIVWFSVGVFPIFPSVIATGSMQPVIDPGDIIIVKKVDNEKLEIGDIIQFKDEDILISHRIIEILEHEGRRVYKTKGDNNSVKDSEPVSPDQIKGKIVYTIPKLGLITLYLKSNKDIPIERVEF